MDATVTEVEIWSRAIQPESGNLSAAAARELLQWRLDDEDQKRVRELSGKSNSGNLTGEETQE